MASGPVTKRADGARAWKWWRWPRRKVRRGSGLSARGAAILLLAVGIAAIGTAAWLGGRSSGRIAAGVTVAGIDVGRRTPVEARKLIAEKAGTAELVFSGEGRTVRMPAAAAAGRPALAVFDPAEASRLAYNIGRETDAFVAIVNRLRAYIFTVDLAVPVEMDHEAVSAALHQVFSEADKPAENARLEVRLDANGKPLISVVPEKDGTVPDIERALEQAESRLAGLSAEPVEVRFIHDRPELSVEDIEPLAGLVPAALERAPLRLAAKNVIWTVGMRTLADWLTSRPADDPVLGKAQISLDEARINESVTAHAAKTETAPKDAAFEMVEGKVTKFEPSEDGEAVDIEAARKLLDEALFGETAIEGAIDLPYKPVPPAISTAAANPYGIKEIIGIGESNFRGSPKNRRSNIKNGAAILDGILVMPDEEFSTIKALLPIDKEHGYLEELVIKGNETKPEFGGGLCQIGTTMFRTVLAAGLPVLERRNHSYRVVYYERDGSGKYMGPGKDATIYDPWPDMKFKNDTGHAIIIRTAISGDRLAFTFWGVSDGRKAEQTEARVWNEVPPPEKKVVETTDLPPGETKCTESPHPGADTAFTYTVTYADGTAVKKDFYSHYRPWGEVCLVGIDPNAVPVTGGVISADASGAAGE